MKYLLALALLLAPTAALAGTNPNENPDHARNIHLHVGQTVYFTGNGAGFPAHCLGSTEESEGFYKPKQGEMFQVASVTKHDWEAGDLPATNHDIEPFWTMKTAGGTKFCMRDTEVDISVSLTPL